MKLSPIVNTKIVKCYDCRGTGEVSIYSKVMTKDNTTSPIYNKVCPLCLGHGRLEEVTVITTEYKPIKE